MTARLFVIIAFLASCNRSDDPDKLSTYTTENLQRARQAISGYTYDQFRQMEESGDELSYNPRVETWIPRAEVCKEKTAEMERYLGELKGQVKNEPIFSDKASELLKRLKDFETSISSIDSFATQSLGSNIHLMGISGYRDPGDFYKDYFKGRSPELQIQVIEQLINDVLLVNLAFARYSAIHCKWIDESFSLYSVIVSQNATILRPGEKLKVHAGIGEFTITAKPTITINGRKIQITDAGYAIYEFPVPKRAGKYSVPVEIVYLNQITGKDETYQTIVEYEVFGN